MTESRPSGWLLAGQCLLVYGLSWAVLLWLQYATPYIVPTDSYFHIKLSWLIRTQGIPEEFPWAPFSLWNERYFDKDFGFHVLLLPFTFGDLVTGAKLSAVTFGSAVFASLFLILRLEGIRWAWLWTLVLFAAGSHFGLRVNLTRPHVISIALSLWAVFAISRRSPKALGAVSVVYALSYTAPFLTILYSAIHTTVSYAIRRSWDFRLPIAASVGVLVGWLVHPQFPNNVIGVWVQIVDSLRSAWGMSGLDYHVPRELGALPARFFLIEHQAVFVAMGAAAWSLWRLRDRRDPILFTLAVISLSYLVLALQSYRFIEYWVPFTVWFAAAALDRLSREIGLASGWWHRQRVVLAVVGIGTILFVGSLFRSLAATWLQFSNKRTNVYEEPALWLAEQTPENAQVFTCDWDDSPQLFFFNHRNRYMVFLDPNFMYRWDPEMWRAWVDVARGEDSDPITTISDRFGARFGVCTNGFSALKEQLLADPEVRVHSFEHTYTFEILQEG